MKHFDFKSVLKTLLLSVYKDKYLDGRLARGQTEICCVSTLENVCRDLDRD
jgi:hypothetical protein